MFNPNAQMNVDNGLMFLVEGYDYYGHLAMPHESAITVENDQHLLIDNSQVMEPT